MTIMWRRPLTTTLVAVALAASAPALSAEAASGQDRLFPNEDLATDQAILNGGQQFLMQGDGNAVVYSDGVVRFSTGTTGAPGSRFVMQGDGNAVVYDPSGRPRWSSGTAGNPGSSIVMQPDSNLALYSASGQALWSSFTGRIAPPPPPPPPASDTLSPGATLDSGQRLATGANQAVMQSDGNFVLYNSQNRALFQTRTAGRPGSRLVMQTDGNAVIYSTSNQPVYSTVTSGNPNSRMVVQGDGNLVIYKADGAPSWSAFTGPIRPPAPPAPPAPPTAQTSKGWSEDSVDFSADFFNEFKAVARLTNRNRTTQSAGFTITVFQGNRVVATLLGSADAVPPGETVTVTFFSSDAYTTAIDRQVFQTDYTFTPS